MNTNNTQPLIDATNDNFELIKKLAKIIMNYVDGDINILDDDPACGVEIGCDFAISPVYDENRIKWLPTVFVHHPGSFNPYDGGTPPDVTEKELPLCNTPEEAIIALQVELLKDIAADIRMDYEESKFRHIEKEDLPPPDEKCPHGEDFVNCNACLTASDLAYDEMRERNSMRFRR